MIFKIRVLSLPYLLILQFLTTWKNVLLCLLFIIAMKNGIHFRYNINYDVDNRITTTATGFFTL